MNSVIKKAFVVGLSIICFFAAKVVVKSVIEGSRTESTGISVKEEVFRNEVSESGIDAAAGKEVLDSVKAMTGDTNKMATLKEAYGDVNGLSTKEIRGYLNRQPERKALVGNTMENLMRESMSLPIQLDEYTSITGVHYSVSTESFVYHYKVANEALEQFDGNYDALKAALEKLNPDSACKISLELLGQGFDMSYSYRNTRGVELFSIVRTYNDCERMGFNKYS